MWYYVDVVERSVHFCDPPCIISLGLCFVLVLKLHNLGFSIKQGLHPMQRVQCSSQHELSCPLSSWSQVFKV